MGIFGYPQTGPRHTHSATSGDVRRRSLWTAFHAAAAPDLLGSVTQTGGPTFDPIEQRVKPRMSVPLA